MKKKLRTTIISGSLIVIAWISNYFGFMSLFDALMILAAIVAGYQVAINAYNTLKKGVLTINALVTIAAVGAIIIGEYWEAAAVTFLFTFGNYLEAKTMSKTRDAIRSLMDLAPDTATVIRNGQQKEIPAREVEVDELVVVKPGEKIPVDGTVIKGASAVNQSSITGESIPVNKEQGDEVYSGTINEQGYLQIKAEKTGGDTKFAKIIELVEEAQEDKSPTQEMMEKFSRYYTPGIIILALGSYFVTQDIRLALTLLVIGCPGALVISTPISIVSGIGNAAHNGVLIKGGEYLEKAGSADVILFDKTGTLTLGQPEVTDIIPVNSSKDELLNIAASAEQNSEHHLATAILNQVEDKNNLIEVDDFTAKTGKGIIATIKDGIEVLVGNERLFNEQKIEIQEELLNKKNKLEAAGKTVILVSKDETLLGMIGIADSLREKAVSTIKRLQRLGIKKVEMLTGDNQRIADSIANQLNLDDYRAELLPADKVERVKELQNQGHKVAMVGDGINDAPSLATADIGIAMGGVGTDVAIDTADITLMADDLDKLPFAIGLSKATARNIKQNIIFAVLIVFTLLAGVLGQKVFLASGMLVHELSVLLVILNAMRLLRYDN